MIRIVPCSPRRRGGLFVLPTLLMLPVIVLAGEVGPVEDTAVTDLKKVVVTATASERDVDTAPASVTVITGEELRARPARDVLDALRDAPGLNIRAVGGLGRRVVSMRGMESRHTLVLVDGERIAATDQVFGLSDLQFGWVPLEAIERIEIVRGPLSSLYGSDALGGVINIITRDAGKAWGGSARLTAGNTTRDAGGDNRQASVHLAGPLGKTVSLVVDAAWQKQQPQPDSTNARLDQREGQEQASLRTRLQWQLAEDQRLALTLMKSDEDRWYRTSTGRVPVYYQQSYDFDRSQVGLSYDGNLGGGYLHLAAQVADIQQVQRNTEGVAPSPEQAARESSLSGHYGIALGQQHQLTVGFEAREERLEHPSFVRGHEALRQVAGFVQDEWAITETFDLVAGARLDHHELFGNEVSPRLYAVWQPAEHWTLKGGYSRGFKAPMLKQISPDYRFVGPHSFIGNPDVRPEKSGNFEVSLGYVVDAYWLRATGYHNKVNGLIDAVCISQCSRPLGRLYHYANVSDARIRGAELELGMELPWHLRLSGAYGYNDARNAELDQRLIERPLQTGSARLQGGSAEQNWQWELRHEYIGGQLTAAMRRQQSYGLWHASLKRRLFGSASLQLGMENIADHRVEDVGAYSNLERGRYVYATLAIGF